MAPEGGVHHDLMSPDMTHMIGCYYAYRTHESLAAPPLPNTKINGTDDLQPGCQDLCPIIAQTQRI